MKDNMYFEVIEPNHQYEHFSFFRKLFSSFIYQIQEGNPGGEGYELTKYAYQQFQMEGSDLLDDHLFNTLDAYFKKTVIPHKIAVYRAGIYLYKEIQGFGLLYNNNIPHINDFKRLLVLHDLSKFSNNERSGYMKHDFKSEHLDLHFEMAWNHHKKNNPHHPEYWMSVNKSGEVLVLPIPAVYCLEMVADWIGAGQVYGNKLEDWLPENLPKFAFHPATVTKLESILLAAGVQISVHEHLKVDGAKYLEVK